jgi:hypothetical protein
MGRLALLDLDGVIADDRHRVQHALARDWNEYFGLMHRDAVWPQGRELYDAAVISDWTIGYCTGRREDTRQVTRRWLKHKGFDHQAPLIMRRHDDRRPLAELKAMIVREALDLYDQVIMYDDDPHVIEMVALVPGARAHHCQWYRKPDRMVRRGSA